MRVQDVMTRQVKTIASTVAAEDAGTTMPFDRSRSWHRPERCRGRVVMTVVMRCLSFVVLALLVVSSEGAAQYPSLSPPASAPAVAQAAGPPQQPGPQPPAPQRGVQPDSTEPALRQQDRAVPAEPVAEIRYAIGPLILVGLVMLVLGALFLLMLSYSNRIAQTGPLGTQVTDALITIKQQQIVKALDEKWSAGGYHRELIGNGEWLSQNPVPRAGESVDRLRGRVCAPPVAAERWHRHSDAGPGGPMGRLRGRCR
jgi:hypothetical protein